jgi:hypothetical protein
MEKKKLIKLGSYILVITVIGIIMILSFKGCKSKPAQNPAVTRLETLNDSLLKVIDKNTKAANELYLKIDSLNFRSDTIIQKQYTVNKYYKDEIYNILNADDPTSNKQFRSTLQKSDSLLKSGFYSKTYDLRPAVNEFKLH